MINSPSTEKALAGLQQEQTILYHPGKSGCQKVESVHVSHAEMHWGHVGITLIGYNRRALGFKEVEWRFLGRFRRYNEFLMGRRE